MDVCNMAAVMALMLWLDGMAMMMAAVMHGWLCQRPHWHPLSALPDALP
jgi:hypothetical protein